MADEAPTTAPVGTETTGDGQQGGQDGVPVTEETQDTPKGGDDGGSGERSIEHLPKWAQDHIKELRSEAASWRTKLREQEEQQELSQMSEVERQVAEARKEAEQQALERARSQMTKVAARAKLAEEQIVNPSDRTLRLLDLDNVTVDEDGTVSGLDEAVEALKADYPTLKKGSTTNPDLGNRQPTERPADMNDVIRKAAGR